MAGQGRHKAVKGVTRQCKYCGKDFEPLQASQEYCEPKHRVYACQERRVMRAFQASLRQHRVT